MIKVKKKSGKIMEYPVSKVKSVLKTTGYTGKLLVSGTAEILGEIKKLTKSGIITATNFEKAVVRGVNNTNKIAMDTTQKATKRILK